MTVRRLRSSSSTWPRRTRAGARRRLRALLPVAAGALGAAAALAAVRRSRTADGTDPFVPLPGNPRLLEVLGGTVPHDQAVHGQPAHLLGAGRTLLGREPGVGVRLQDATVSPRHAAVDVDDDGHAVVHDLGARNGVQVDGIPVATAVLHDGARLTLGGVELVFKHDRLDDGPGRQGGELGEQAG